MSGNGDPALAAQGGFHPTHDARRIVKLFQCSLCSYPLRDAVALPCGNSMCKACIPPVYKRENITYPQVQGRSEGFICPFTDCGLEHSLGDCGTDVTVNKIVDVVQGQMSTYSTQAPGLPLLLEETLDLSRVADSAMDIMPRSRVLHGGRIVASYILARMGELNYHSDLSYTPLETNSEEAIALLDRTVHASLQEIVKSELECQVCYQVMLDPLTTSCGHTFCRKCFARAMDHSNVCPMCRRRLTVLPSATGEPSNKRIAHLLQHLLPDLLDARIAVESQEDTADEESSLPLFPCTLAYPQMPTFLHIFEPRYRLMVRRAIENGSRKFGMLMYRPGGPGPGEPAYMHYGTVLFIERIEILPDGRSLIETRGLYRFRVITTSMVDGYLVGQVQRIDDIPVHEEENAESHETSTEPSSTNEAEARIQSMSTQRLLEYGLEFVEQARSKSARWLHQRVLAAYGQPPSDPATFPYWLASVLPIAESEKYLLLPATSVRERLKITARWIQRLEAARW